MARPIIAGNVKRLHGLMGSPLRQLVQPRDHRRRSSSRHDETVVLLHGMGRTRVSMLSLASALKREGYTVLNVSYPWRSQTLFQLATEWLPALLQPHSHAKALHFVTHSMGGILVRLWLRENPAPANLGRVVMLAPPNAGSELPERMTRWAPLRWLLGPNAGLLGTTADHLPQRLGAWPNGAGELAVIAGSATLHPLFDRWLPPPHDGKVSVASTHLAGERVHFVVPASHTWLGWRRETVAHVLRFLRTGTMMTPSH